MGFLDLFSSSSSTQNTAYNEQTGVEGSGSMAIGANSSNNRISITSADPEIANAAIQGEATTADSALRSGFAFAQSANLANAAQAGLSIESANDLATKFMTSLQSNSQETESAEQASFVSATQAEQSALANVNNLASQFESRYADIVNAQTPNGAALAAQTTTSKTQISIALIIGIAAVALFLFSRKE